MYMHVSQKDVGNVLMSLLIFIMFIYLTLVSISWMQLLHSLYKSTFFLIAGDG
jgi:hypothetical protein